MSSTEKVTSYAVVTAAARAAHDVRPARARTGRRFFRRFVLPFTGIAAALLVWQLAVNAHPASLIPGPLAVARAVGELAVRGLLVKYVVASLFRVSWGYTLALIVSIALGLFLGISRRAELTLNPL